MSQPKDTLFITDSVQRNPSVQIIPADSLWGAETTSVIIPGNLYSNYASHFSAYFKSGVTLVYLILLLLFFKTLATTLTTILKGFFNLKVQLSIEDRLADTRQRNTTALISVFTIAIVFIYTFDNYLWAKHGIKEHSVFLGILLFFTGFWIFKTIVLRFTGWITKSPTPFNLIGKIGYNHLIFASILTLPLLLLHLVINSNDITILFYYLLICYLLIYLIYLSRVRQTIISHHFSHVFYILYLCTAEILPVALLINFILSNQ